MGATYYALAGLITPDLSCWSTSNCSGSTVIGPARYGEDLNSLVSRMRSIGCCLVSVIPVSSIPTVYMVPCFRNILWVSSMHLSSTVSEMSSGFIDFSSCLMSVCQLSVRWRLMTSESWKFNSCFLYLIFCGGLRTLFLPDGIYYLSLILSRSVWVESDSLSAAGCGSAVAIDLLGNSPLGFIPKISSKIWNSSFEWSCVMPDPNGRKCLSYDSRVSFTNISSSRVVFGWA